jgi:hypothetical protein
VVGVVLAANKGGRGLELINTGCDLFNPIFELPPMATNPVQHKLDKLLELTSYKVVQGAGDQRLIGDPFQ